MVSMGHQGGVVNGPRMEWQNICRFVLKVGVKFGGFSFRGSLVSRMALFVSISAP